MIDRFPTFKAGHIFNKYPYTIEENLILKYDKINLEYPCRMDAMAINPAAVCYNDNLIFTPGEVVVSLNRKIKVSVEIISETGGLIEISERTQRKVLIKHAYKIMSNTLKVNPSVKIDVDSSEIIKHCGFGSSSSTIAAVASAINELYGHPISNKDLIKFLASNHGEEISDENEEDLKMVQCIGGGATNGLTEEGIIIIAGKATSIAKLKYESDVLIGIPKDFKTKNADELMKLEEENLWKFKKTGDEYAEKIAYNLLHKALPDLCNGSIRELADIVFNYRFNMGSIENCSFVYKKMLCEARELRKLYENGNCEFLTLSSVGPAFMAIVKDNKQKQMCKETMEKIGMNVIETSICNNTYEVTDKQERKNFWKDKKTAKEFTERPISQYIINEIEQILNNKEIQKAIDVGCGGGRYSRFLKQKGIDTLAIDKYKEMAFSLREENINFIQANMDNIPMDDDEFDLILCIGVIHNAVTKKEFIDTIKEFYRLLRNDGYVVLSVFTNDVISDDLKCIDDSVYDVLNKSPMVLLSKDEICEIVKDIGFYIDKKVDEHITNVGTGKRNVYTIRLRK
ncbi:MAG TPA: hypothetical protein DCZ30_03255 [Clostridiales bacterium]|nr:hypothetical protein [Clostridiales bacterium]